MKRLYAILVILGTMFGSCSTEFDIVAPYKEVIVINGLLNAFDSIQYVKVGKAYLGEGNAYVMAQQFDSLYYADILDVKLERLNASGQVVQTLPLTRSTSVPKDDGIFAYPSQVLYTTNTPIIQDGSRYKITVRNTTSNQTATSTTKIVKDLSLRPILVDSLDFVSSAAPINVSFAPGENSRMFDMILRFHYSEISPAGDTTVQSIDWNFNDQFVGTSLPDVVRFAVPKADFYRYLGSNIPVKPGFVRRFDHLPPGVRCVEFRLIQASEDLMTYYQLLNPTGVVQEPPTFTTVTNGIGLFSSRIIHSEFRDLNTITKLSFDTNQFTAPLNFRY